jgi:hypothetical protein
MTPRGPVMKSGDNRQRDAALFLHLSPSRFLEAVTLRVTGHDRPLTCDNTPECARCGGNAE